MTGRDAARAVADAVLYEGYVLYPYRATAEKNQLRFQWGVLVPPAVSAHDPTERSSALTTVVVDAPGRTLSATLRLLQLQRRTVHAFDGSPVERLEAGETTYLPFDEAQAHELTVQVPLDEGRVDRGFDIEGGVEVEEVPGGSLRRERLPLRLRVEAEVILPASPYRVAVVAVRVSSEGEPGPVQEGRPAWLRRSLVAAHLLLEIDSGRFVSQLDPPQWAAGFVAECRNDGLFPVLAGAPGDDRVMLSSPVILYDHPRLAPESGTPFFDSLEIDELIGLRTLTLSDAEKREVRGTDRRVAAMLDDVEALPPEQWARLHGALRTIEPTISVEPDPDTDSVEIAGTLLRRGSPVLLRPGARRADAYDLLLAGRRASVAGVFRDLDDRVHLAVVLDDDPGADLRLEHGRYLYFAPDEVEPLPAEAGQP